MTKAPKKAAKPLKKTQTAAANSAAGVTWKLTDLYRSPDDPALERDLDLALRRASAFEKKFKGAFTRKPGMTGKNLSLMLEEFEQILILRDKPVIYAHLLFSGDTQSAAFGKLLQKTQSRSTAIQKHLIFAELEWCALDEAKAEKLIANPSCARWKHYLQASRRYRPHLLSEPEEKIVSELENTGSRAFVRLFDQSLGAMKFELKHGGKTSLLSEQEALSLLYSADRPERQAAAEALTRGFEANLAPLTFIFNTIVDHHATIDRLRSYAHPMAARHLGNETDKRTVDTLLAACDAHSGLVGRYYRLKTKLLGLKKLYDYDRYAPISANLPGCSWKEGQEIVRSAYAEFSPEFGDIVDRFFRERWIDAELRPGKRGGAFSAGTTPDLHPFILLNYSDRLRDVATLAHELGHGIHQFLSQKQGYIQSDTPLTLAETASVFGEMLTFHRLLDSQKKPEVRLALLCSKIEDIFATVFRQAALTRFEQRLHDARRKDGELDADTISRYWMETNTAMFDGSVELTPGYRHWWCYITHFIHSPFYCYAYAFGEMLVLSLYALYRRQGAAFVPKYRELLAAGGSASPVELTRRVGLDITRPVFWKQGMLLIDELVSETEELAAGMKPRVGR